MLSKFLLVLIVVSFCGYGALALLSPETVSQFIGYGLSGPDSRIELIAMYGGFEIGLGLFCLLGLMNQDLERPALIAVALMVGGLAVTRAGAHLLSSEAVTSYTYGALVFEFTITALAMAALSTRKQTHIPGL